MLIFLFSGFCKKGTGDEDIYQPDAADVLTDNGDASETEEMDYKQGDITELEISDQSAESTDDSISDAGEIQKGPWYHFDLTVQNDIFSIWADKNGLIYAAASKGKAYVLRNFVFLPLTAPVEEKNFNDIFGSSDLLFIAGDEGLILSRQPDQLWKVEQGNTKENLRAGIYFEESGIAYIAGDHGTILKRTEGKWSKEESNVPFDLYSLAGSSPEAVYAVGSGGNLLKRVNGSWVLENLAGVQVILHSIWREPSGKMFAVGSNGSIQYYNGDKWAPQLSNDTQNRDLYAVRAFSDTEVYAAGDKGAIIKFDGKKWSLMNVEGPYNAYSDLRALYGVRKSKDEIWMIASGLEGKSLVFDGKTWKDLSSTPHVDFHDVFSSEGFDTVVAGDNGIILSFDGMRWGFIESGFVTALNSVHKNFIAGNNGVILQIENGKIKPVVSDTENDLFDIFVSGDGSIRAVGSDGLFIKRDAGKENFQAVYGLPPKKFYSIAETGTNRNLIAGESGHLFKHDNGIFTALSSKTGSNLWNIYVAKDNEAYVCGDNGIILKISDEIVTVENEDPTNFLYGIGGDSTAGIFAAGWAGLIVKQQENKWVQEDAGYSYTFKSVSGTGKGSVFFVGIDGAILEYIKK
jgi:photosystem II stability/assembly factor-like uncharacterized protein